MTSPAKPASTVVLLRDGAAGLEALLVRRHDAMAFMGGAHVFPGGRVEDSDADDRHSPGGKTPDDLTTRLNLSEWGGARLLRCGGP